MYVYIYEHSCVILCVRVLQPSAADPDLTPTRSIIHSGGAAPYTSGLLHYDGLSILRWGKMIIVVVPLISHLFSWPFAFSLLLS